MYRMRQSPSVFSSLEGPWWLAGFSGANRGGKGGGAKGMETKNNQILWKMRRALNLHWSTTELWFSKNPESLPADVGHLDLTFSSLS